MQQIDTKNVQQAAAQYCNNAKNLPQPEPLQPASAPNTASPEYSYQYYKYPQANIYPQTQGQNCSIPSNTSGVNIQIFNPTVAPAGAQPPSCNVNAPNYYSVPQNIPNSTPHNAPVNTGGEQTDVDKKTTSTTETTNKKTEKKKVVELTDEYIKNLENYLNSQDKEVRLNAANEVFARLEEDPSRKDDKALTALINKMLQDSSEQIKLLALTALDSGIVMGDDYTKGVLQQMQSSDGGFGQDAADASKILLKMSGKQVEKEVPVTETKKSETKTEKSKKE